VVLRGAVYGVQHEATVLHGPPRPARTASGPVLFVPPVPATPCRTPWVRPARSINHSGSRGDRSTAQTGPEKTTVTLAPASAAASSSSERAGRRAACVLPAPGCLPAESLVPEAVVDLRTACPLIAWADSAGRVKATPRRPAYGEAELRLGRRPSERRGSGDVHSPYCSLRSGSPSRDCGPAPRGGQRAPLVWARPRSIHVCSNR